MQLQDIASHAVVFLRDGSYGLTRDGIIVPGKGRCIKVHEFDPHCFRHIRHERLDIVKIIRFNNMEPEVLFDRSLPMKKSITELETILGYKIEVI